MKNKNYRSFICGIRGTNLSYKEKIFLLKYRPWGIILFERNIKSINQTQKLTKSIKLLFNNKYYPILLDEEGGKVSRLSKFIDNSLFSANYFGTLFKKDINKFKIFSNVYVKQISYLFRTLGININTIPVLDVRRKFSNNIIGNRSYSSNKYTVSKLGDIFINLFHRNKIATVIKHIPGHGLAKVDSHKKLPLIKKNLKYLIKSDFFTFKKKQSLFAMTGHLLFEKIDNLNSVTHSKKIIKLIRKKIGFKNIIITDDISMKALKYSIKENTLKSFESGCNLVLHCNGNLKQMKIVALNSPKIDNFIIKKTSQLIDIIS